jgi:hypothetical protein
MPKRLRGAAGVVVVAAVFVALAWGSFAIAKTVGPTTPSIDDLLGYWSAKISGIEYAMSPPSQLKYKLAGTYHITQSGENTVNMHFQGGGQTFDTEAYYTDGVLVFGASDDASLGTWSISGYAIISGKPGRLSAKGQWTKWDAVDNYLQVCTETVRMLPPGPFD